MTRVGLVIAFVVSLAVSAATTAMQRARLETPAPVERDFRG